MRIGDWSSDVCSSDLLGAPLRVGPWAAIHSPEWPRGHRRVLYAVAGRARIPGRFAIDWVRLDADGRSARGDADRVAHALAYAAEVLEVRSEQRRVGTECVRECRCRGSRCKNQRTK